MRLMPLEGATRAPTIAAEQTAAIKQAYAQR